MPLRGISTFQYQHPIKQSVPPPVSYANTSKGRRKGGACNVTYLLVQSHAVRMGMRAWLRPKRSENHTEVGSRLCLRRQRARSRQ
jgi:hypothetical protein